MIHKVFSGVFPFYSTLPGILRRMPEFAFELDPLEEANHFVPGLEIQFEWKGVSQVNEDPTMKSKWEILHSFL